VTWTPFGGEQRGHAGGVDEHVVVDLLVAAPGAVAGPDEGGDLAHEPAGCGQREARDDRPVVVDAGGGRMPAAAGAWPRARSSIAAEASVAMTRCPAAVSSPVSRPLPQPSSRTSPFRDRTGSRAPRSPARRPGRGSRSRSGEQARGRGGNKGLQAAPPEECPAHGTR
jgi:hypothetical protein